MEKDRLQELIVKYTSGQIDKPELTELLDYVVARGESPEMQSLLTKLLETTNADDSLQLDADALYRRITHAYRGVHRRKSPLRLPRWWHGAAAVLLAAICLWVFKGDILFGGDTSYAKEMRTVTTTPTDKPLLRLADGRTIYLDSMDNGALATEDGIQISLQNGTIYYTDKAHSSTDESLENTIITPKGRQYQVVLPDGSKLWLNAASTVSYPIRFNSKKREITVSGEVYLEVEHAAEWPFVVDTKMQQIEVVGTKFNVSAYSDDLTTKTTLVDGRVKVSFVGEAEIQHAQNSIMLKPGQQLVSTESEKGGRVIHVDPEEMVSWKDNLFVFSDEEISEVMKKVSRWYDVEIEYLDGMAGKRIGGSIPRLTNVEELMNALEDTGLLHYKMEGGTIVVMR
ncbi:iron dicitrate transporter FecR [Parapedobacter pyrenivorans]|uniref:Iron dicitrate transporter FecR n=1 Tax=Parapedobacter pyrenivorans TaxID=1305674 RepID=A0A917HEE6_9SPHI|nr:FecR domain-containing protein [Parapedobacter pyrenivorans]GGG75284.1 iron dicitrate transporter FecR [Parapedobacter pyrenivorans]